MEKLLPMDEVLCQERNGVGDRSIGGTNRNTEEDVPGRKQIPLEVLHTVPPALESGPEGGSIGAGVDEVEQRVCLPTEGAGSRVEDADAFEEHSAPGYAVDELKLKTLDLREEKALAQTSLHSSRPEILVDGSSSSYL